MSLEIKKTALYKASFWINPKTALAKKRSIIGLLLLCLAFGFEFGYIVLATDWGSLWADRALAGAILTLAWALFFWQKNNFVEAYKKPKLYYSLSDLIASPTDFNTADFLDYESILVFIKALSFKQQGSNLALLFAFVLAKPKILQFIFNRTQLSLNEVTQFLKQALTQDSPPQNWQALVLQAGQRALALKKTRIDCGDLLVVLSQALEPWQRYLNDNGLLPADIEHLVEWHERIQNNLETRRQFYSLNNLRKRGNLARDWSASYTISLDRFIDVDYVAQIQRNNFRPIIGHQKEILALERALSKNSQNNALLVGEAGCGKKSLIEAIAQKSFTNQSTVQINDKRIIQFDIASLVSVIEGKEKTESLLDLCLAEATRAGNVILIIDNFHQYVGAKSQAGLINITAILSRYLPLKSFRLIGLTTYEGC
ncbi:MAG: AAA family ATPase [Candidatus Gribaldobacteria bacterium]|nr:AAA family ATPase [Candidatus Gribaldobacteria bacterium]